MGKVTMKSNVGIISLSQRACVGASLHRIKLLLEVVSSCFPGKGHIIMVGSAFHYPFYSVHLPDHEPRGWGWKTPGPWRAPKTSVALIWLPLPRGVLNLGRKVLQH